MKLPDHKRTTNTRKCANQVQFKDDEFEMATATIIEETKKVSEARFDCAREKDGILPSENPRGNGMKKQYYLMG